MKKPKYVHGFIDRHGKARFYFRRPGMLKVPLPGLPWSPEFMAAYEQALAGQPVEIGASRVKPGTIRALAVSYFNSTEFHSMGPDSQRGRRRIIENFCEEKDRAGGKLGDKGAASMQREHIVRLLAARADRPEAANNLRKALRAMMQHAVEVGLRKDDPTANVKAIRVKSQGFHSWTDAEIEQFEAHHAIGSRARLAMALLLFTGQRRSDVVRMGRQHIRDGLLYVRQAKTRTELAIPVHAELQRVMDASASGQMTFLVTEFGKPFTPAGFGNWFRDQCNAAGLRHCSAHGLRKAAARRLAEAGCSAHEIAAITGHASLYEVSRYTRAADQRRLAEAAMLKVGKGTASG